MTIEVGGGGKLTVVIFRLFMVALSWFSDFSLFFC